MRAADHPVRGMRSLTFRRTLGTMSILCQIAPRDPDGLLSIDIPTSATRSLPHLPIVGAPGTPSGSGRVVRADAEAVSRALLVGIGAEDEAVAELEARLDENVEVWTPTLHTTTRFELISLMVDLDDAIGDVMVVFAESVATQSVAIVGWQVTGRFVRPVYLDDDRLFEPTGAVIRLAGAASVAFTTTGRAERVRCYYDRLALLEQIVLSCPDRTSR